jgi:hypothetical protein
MGLPPNVHMSLVHLAGEFEREELLMGQTWGLDTIDSEVLGTRKGASSILESLVSVLLLYLIPNVISYRSTF